MPCAGGMRRTTRREGLRPSAMFRLRCLCGGAGRGGRPGGPAPRSTPAVKRGEGGHGPSTRPGSGLFIWGMDVVNRQQTQRDRWTGPAQRRAVRREQGLRGWGTQPRGACGPRPSPGPRGAFLLEISDSELEWTYRAAPWRVLLISADRWWDLGPGPHPPPHSPLAASDASTFPAGTKRPPPPRGRGAPTSHSPQPPPLRLRRTPPLLPRWPDREGAPREGPGRESWGGGAESRSPARSCATCTGRVHHMISPPPCHLFELWLQALGDTPFFGADLS